MMIGQLESDHVRLEVGTKGGFLYPVEFLLEDGRSISPLHCAPWIKETVPEETPPMLRGLRGDFFCAPFGTSDLTPEETRPHGATANANWKVISSSQSSLTLELEPSIMDSRVTKHVFLQANHPIIYQEHILCGGQGKIPIGHHAMLHTKSKLLLGFSSFIWAGTPPDAPEPNPTLGRSKLKYPQEFSSLKQVQLKKGEHIDLQNYPVLESSEEILMLVSDPTVPFAWSAATNQEEGWVWFALKDPNTLPSTVLWLSNGGRDYPPFSSRHTGVIGIEEVNAYIHLGHQASLENPLLQQGIQTFIQLEPEKNVSIRYAFGVAATTKGFSRVTRIFPDQHELCLEDKNRLQIRIPCDLKFITNKN